ncbi:MAG: FAD-dependent oxidoreductase [Candidatus Omnitrophica bacterium]|nr:FAD-dependent oxidoreductase [Candidatus Omnitrophota bacterium]
MQDNLFDLIIIGAGPAGITGAVYAARKGLNFLVLTGDIGGQAAWSSDIENYTGYQFVSGAELTIKFEEHMKKYNIDIRENEPAGELSREGDIVLVKTAKTEYAAKSVVIASGKQSKELGVPGEKEFRNKGLAYCATCDGPLFAGKDVAVIGGGNSALDAALQLIKIAKKIFIVNISPELGGDAVMRDKVIKSGKVIVMNNTRVTGVLGDKFVSGISVSNAEGERELAVEGVFVEIGLIPNSDFAADIEKNDQGEIKVNCRNETNVKGVFAAGDVTDVPEKQIIIAAGEGSKAVLTASRYLAIQE